MRKRIAVWSIWLGIAAMIACLVVGLDPTYVLWGLLNGESFYRGRPTTYWSMAIREWHRLSYEEKQKHWEADPNFESPFSRPDPSAVPVLIELLADSDSGVNGVACNSLGIVGPDAKAAVPALAELLRHPDVFYRRRASNTLGSIGPEAKAAMGVLINGLKDEDAWVNYCCALTLGRIGPEAKEAFPVLLEVLKSPKAQEAAYPRFGGKDWTVGDAVIRAFGADRRGSDHKGGNSS